MHACQQQNTFFGELVRKGLDSGNTFARIPGVRRNIRPDFHRPASGKQPLDLQQFRFSAGERSIEVAQQVKRRQSRGRRG